MFWKLDLKELEEAELSLFKPVQVNINISKTKGLNFILNDQDIYRLKTKIHYVH